jgi:uncharacterized integral membrane protein
MRLRTVSLLILLLAIALFVILNWDAFMAPTSLSLAVTRMEAPLGLVMLAIMAVLVMAFVAYVAFLQTSVIVESRRYARELKVQRELADQAEASRVTELRQFLDERLQGLDRKIVQVREGLEAGLDRAQQDLRATVEQTGNMLSAYVAEVEDRLERHITAGRR